MGNAEIRAENDPMSDYYFPKENDTIDVLREKLERNRNAALREYVVDVVTIICGMIRDSETHEFHENEKQALIYIRQYNAAALTH